MRLLSILAMALWATASPLARAQADGALPPPRYTVQSDEPRTGSHIRSVVVKGESVPLNRTYAQLTPAEQDLVKAQYERMAPGDEPPFPLEGLYPVEKRFQQVIQATQAAGVLALVANVDASGTVTSVDRLRDGDPAALQAAANILLLTRFKPAVCAGQPCAMGFPLRMTIVRAP